MKKIINYLIIAVALLSFQFSYAQDVSINIATDLPSIPLGTSTAVLVTICNEDPSPIDAPSNKLRPQISVGPNVTITGATNADGSALTGWSIQNLSTGNANTIRLVNTVPLVNGDCVQFRVTILGTVVSPSTVFNGTLGFVGPQTPGNNTANDNSPTSVAVTAPVATPPVATPNVATTPAGTPVTLTVTTNDTPGSAAIAPATVKLIDPATNLPAVGNTVTIPGTGTFTVDPTTGAVTFTPVAGFTGAVPPVNYTVDDVNGLTSNPAPITVTVTGTPPVATPDPATTPINTPVMLTVTTNDTPGSGAIAPATVKLIDPATNLPAVGNTVTIPGTGTFTVDPTTGVVTFTPATGFIGVVPPVSYTVDDVNGMTSNPAPINVTVTGTPPVATNDTGSSTPTAPAIIPVVVNDIPGSSPLDPTTVKLIDPITGLPSPSVTIPNEGTYTVDPITGVITFVQDPGITTPITSTITYTVKDVNGLTSNPATITINATPLPVTLTVFKVTKEGKVAKLNWETTEETNSDHFEIQHSISGKDWNKIGTVDSHGDSKVKNVYTFTDVNPANGENLYRLKMVDRDATYAYSRIQSIKFDGLNSAAVSVYPNPSSDKVFIQDMDLAQVKQVSIVDMNGRALFSSDKVSADGINVSKFNPGTYILHITNVNGTVSNHKIVIAK
ncbi:Ig-like domain-containing protein [Dyadobacter sp. 3J3]|uniref:Ig-like domain-containing protein n=1 Tax=Dyadobacter sp. 3J3 TaxID=2606600 RepID=UPI00135BCF07|nr:T9SS type A sorting domain-containing protein [Dyadobacter sp. 3J3]